MTAAITAAPANDDALRAQIRHLFEVDILQALAAAPDGLVVADLRDRLTVPPRLLELHHTVRRMHETRRLVLARPVSVQDGWPPMRAYHPVHFANL